MTAVFVNTIYIIFIHKKNVNRFFEEKIKILSHSSHVLHFYNPFFSFITDMGRGVLEKIIQKIPLSKGSICPLKEEFLMRFSYRNGVRNYAVILLSSVSRFLRFCKFFNKTDNL